MNNLICCFLYCLNKRIEKKSKAPEKKKRENEDEPSRKKTKISSSSSTSSSALGTSVGNYKTASSSKLTIQHRVVDYMRKRHLEGEDWPLSLNEIIDETQQLDIGYKV